MKTTKTKRGTFVIGSLFGLFFLSILVLCLFINEQRIKPVSKDVFYQEAEVIQEEVTIGTNISLHQEIHGAKGITYRYKLKTDCPYWKYEDRYLTNDPLDWVNKTAAVETNATAITISYQGTTYAQGQFFEVPLLQLTMDDKRKAEYIEELQAEAYTAYTTAQVESGMGFTPENCILVITILLVCFAAISLLRVSKCPHCQTTTDSNKTEEIPFDTIQTEVPQAEQHNDKPN